VLVRQAEGGPGAAAEEAVDPPAHDGSNEDEQAHDHLPSLSNKDEDSNKDDNEEEVASNVDPEDDEEEEAPEHPFAITNINDDEVEFEENETSEEQLARLVEAGPPGDEPLRLAALDFMEAKKAYWQAKEADETQEALSEKIANLKKQKKFYLAMLKFRNKHATLNKATEFRYVGKQGRKYYVEFRQAAGEHITKLTVAEAREWFNYEYLSTAFKFDGWVPLEDTFSHFKAQLKFERKRRLIQVHGVQGEWHRHPCPATVGVSLLQQRLHEQVHDTS
jgi:hypothetical protein